MRKTAVMMLVAATVFLGGAVAAAKPPTEPPGQGECSHGNSGQTCVPDPQPDNGQDCEEHGNQGGVNEDHCAPTTTVSSTTTTVTEPTETTTTDSTTVPTTVPSETTTTSVTEAPPTTSEAPTSTTTETDSGTSTTSEGSTSPSDDGSTDDKPSNEPSKKGLAFTGVENVVPLGATALGLLSAGFGALWLGSRRRTSGRDDAQ